MRIHYVMHAPFESIGMLDAWAKERGFFLCSHKIYEGEHLPNPEEVDFLISMGGPQSAIEWRKYPYLLQEVALMQTLLAKGSLIVGFCLGAQLLSIACGAKVIKSPHSEVGVYPIYLTEEGKKDPITSLMPDSMEVLHWHQDMAGIPANAVILAENKACPQQIVRFTNKALGFQCHLEVDVKRVKDFIKNNPGDLQLKGEYISDEKSILASDFSKMNAILFKIMDILIQDNQKI